MAMVSASIGGPFGENMAHVLTFVPVIEPSGSQDAVITTDLSKHPTKKSWISSVTSGEYHLFLKYDPLFFHLHPINSIRDNLRVTLEEIIRNYTDDTTKIKNGSQELISRYFKDNEDLDHFRKELSVMYQDLFFIFPWIFNGKEHSGRKWLSHFEYKGNISSAANINPQTDKPFTDNDPGHAEEGLYYFNYRSLYPNVGPNETQRDYDVSKRLIQRLINFAYYDNPTPSGSAVQWSQFTTNRILRITEKGDFMADENFTQKFQDIYDLWYGLIGWK
uniref:Carboxylesterase type B domain-containing protein n=1 Tax=Lygus hesperus TaxID=30085 RepID=A0A0K8S6I0_LYGHE